MTTIGINITGPTYTSRSLPLSAQVTRNWYPEYNEPGRSQYALQPWFGQKLFKNPGISATDRGMTKMGALVYRVLGSTLYSVTNQGVHTSIGTIGGNSRCIFANNGTWLKIATGGLVYNYDGATLSQDTEADLETPNAVDYLNNQFIVDGDGGRFGTYDAGSATNLNGLNYATAESHPDDLKRPYVFHEDVYMMGDASIEMWWNTGTGNPPFDRQNGRTIPVGLDALYSAANNDSYLYWLSDTKNIYRVSGGQYENITSIALAHALEGYTTTSDAIGWCISFEGQNFYILHFPSANKTWALNEGLGRAGWFELSSDMFGGKYNCTSYVHAFGKHLLSDATSGNLYELDANTHSNNGSAILRIRDTGIIHSGLYGPPGKRLFMSRFEMLMETGIGISTGQGSSPVVMLQWSDDGGRTWSRELHGKAGVMGDYIKRVEWFGLGSFRSRIFRIKTSDPVFFSLHSAAADIDIEP